MSQADKGIKPTTLVTHLEKTEKAKELEKPTEEEKLDDRQEAEKKLHDSYDETQYDEIIDLEWD